MAGEPVIEDLRVQVVERGDGTRAYTIVWPDGAVHAEADRTYAYLLVDHLRWLERECLPPGSVTLADLEGRGQPAWPSKTGPASTHSTPASPSSVTMIPPGGRAI